MDTWNANWNVISTCFVLILQWINIYICLHSRVNWKKNIFKKGDVSFWKVPVFKLHVEISISGEREIHVHGNAELSWTSGKQPVLYALHESHRRVWIKYFKSFCCIQIWLIVVKFKVCVIENVYDRFKLYVCIFGNSFAIPLFQNALLVDLIVAVRRNFDQQQFSVSLKIEKKNVILAFSIWNNKIILDVLNKIFSWCGLKSSTHFLT